MRLRRALVALSAPLLFVALTAESCGSGSGGSSNGAPPTYHSIFDTPTPPVGGNDKRPSAPASKFPSNPVEGSRVWGGNKLGDCDVYLWPAGTGLSVVPHYYDKSTGYPPPYSAVVADVTTGCLGYQPGEFHIHIHLQRYYSLTLPGRKAQPEAWHDVALPVADDRKPNIVPLDPRTGLMPYFPMTHYTLPNSYLPRLATPCNGAFKTTYRIQLDIIGTSYSGEPFVGGGTGMTWTVTPDMCAHASY